MKFRWSSKLVAVVCVFCLTYGMLSGASLARAEDTDSPADQTQARSVSPEFEFAPEEPSSEDQTSDETPAQALETPDPETEETEQTTERPSFTVQDGMEDLVILVPEELEHATVDNRSTIPSSINGAPISDGVMVNGVPYLCAEDFFTALDINATYSTGEDGTLYVTADGLKLSAAPDACYLTCNNRCLYLEDGVRSYGGRIYLPADELAKCIGAQAAMDMAGWSLDIRFESISPLENGNSYYNSSDLYWMSHLIFAESGNQSLEGQLAVGNVVLNRVNSGEFSSQNSITAVIFAASQFDVVTTGSIYMTPSSEAVVAAKLALEGYNIMSDALFFATFYFGAKYICVDWIEDHCFMTLA